MSHSGAEPRPRFGRYILCEEIASGGMATVYLGRLVAPAGFSRTVALKRLHAAYAKDPEFVGMLMDEARLASRVHHRNVVQVLDVVAADGELILVLEYVHGAPLSRLIQLARRSGEPPPLAMASAILTDVLGGLHAAHDARSELGEPLELVHRDISPQNILVHENGSALVTDFGIARAVGRSQVTREGQTKGKPGYMAPEQIRGEPVTRRTDIFAAGVVLWEVFTGQRLFSAPSDIAIAHKVLSGRVDPPSRVSPGIPPAVDDVALRALALSPAARFETAAEMQHALERAVHPASRSAVAAWVRELAGDYLAERARELRRVEAEPIHDVPEAPVSQRGKRESSDSAMAAMPPSARYPNAATAMTSPRLADESADPTGVSSPTRPARGANGTILLGAALAGVFAGVAAGARVWFTPSAAEDPAPQGAAPRTSEAPTPASTEASVAPGSPSAAQPATSRAPAGAASSGASAPSSPSMGGGAAASMSGSSAPSAPRAAASPTRAPTAAPRRGAAAADDCNPPSYVDSRGITVFKKQCLTKR